MSDPLAVWGAVTGSVATSVLVAHEFRARRVPVAVEHGVNLYMSRENPGEIISGWLLIRVWNRGGRDATVEQVGLAWLCSHSNLRSTARVDAIGSPLSTAPVARR